MCTWLLLVIYAYKKTHILRERFIFGFIMANMLYSTANIIPSYLNSGVLCVWLL